MDTGIRGQAQGRFGSSISAVETARGAGRDKITIERMTGFVPADRVADEIKRADPMQRPELALRFSSLAGEGRGKFPFHLSAAQTHAATERVASFVEGLNRDQLVNEMHRLCDEAERAVLRARNERVLRAEADSLSALVAKVGAGSLLDSQVSDYAFLAALDCDAATDEIVGRIADAVGDHSEWRLDSLRCEAESGARNRAASRQGAEELFEEHLADCESSGWPIFEGYEVDVETDSPNPVEYAEEQFERERAARCAQCEDILRAAEDRLASSPNLREGAVLSVVRHAARETDWDVIGRSTLKRRLVAACEASSDLEHAIDTTIEFVRDDGGRSSDAEIEAVIREHLRGCREHDQDADTQTKPAEAIGKVEAPLARAEAPAAPVAIADDEAAAERRALARAVANINAKRDMPTDNMLAVVRRVANEAPWIPADKLADIMISTSGQMSPYMHDAIRFSIDETRRAGNDFGDAAVADRVERMLKGVHAPLTGQPGVVERNAREVAKANFGGPTLLEWEDPDGLPRRKWLYGFLQRGEFCLTYSLGGVGKTTLWTVEALAIVSGRALLGVAPNEGRGRVWCYSGEEPMHEMKRRIFAACKHYKLGPDDFGGRLFVDNFESCDFVIAEQIRDGVTINKPRVALLVNYLLNNNIDVLFVDPWISTHHVNENDNSAIQQVASAWKEVAVRANVAIHFAHHSRKGSGGNGQDVTQDDARGARALLDKSRGTRSLGSMSKKEAEDFGIPAEDRRRYFYYDPTEGKPNAALATGKKQWFRTASVILGAKRNGPLDFGESVGVVESWTPPEPADKLDREKIDAIREAFGGRRWRVSPQAFRRTDSIYAPIAEVFDLDLDSPDDKKQAGAIYKRLRATKVVVEKTELDEDSRERPYARLPD